MRISDWSSDVCSSDLKPSYLFALVAGNFDCREQTIQTRSGRSALLQVFSDAGTRNKTEWALDCLHRSVKWDENRFGLELDLDRFMIVAAHDFNMRSEEHTSELQSLMRISYAVFCLKKKTKNNTTITK